MTDPDPRAQAVAAAEAIGRCPYSGLGIAACWATELCDCAYQPPIRCQACRVSVWNLGAHQANPMHKLT